MSDPTPPPPGNMYLYDNITPPLEDGSYRLDVGTDVNADGAAQPVPGASNYFDVIGPRFRLPTSDVGGVFPPQNGHGSFSETLPQIALSRRTLPWERELDPGGLIGVPARSPGDPPPPTQPPPWVALLLFEEGEYTFLQNQPLQSVVPHDVFVRLGSPQGITCDAVQAPIGLVQSIMPSVEELTVLAHVRQVNTDDRELSAGSSDGWFAVVMSNRVPNPGAKCLACLVSLEERSDLVPKDPPPAFSLNFAAAGPPGLRGRPGDLHHQPGTDPLAAPGLAGRPLQLEVRGRRHGDVLRPDAGPRRGDVRHGRRPGPPAAHRHGAPPPAAPGPRGGG